MATIVRFNGTNVTAEVTEITSDSIKLNCPDLPPGEYEVTVENSNGVSNSVIFTILEEIDPENDFTKEEYHRERAFNRLFHQYRKPNGRE